MPTFPGQPISRRSASAARVGGIFLLFPQDAGGSALILVTGRTDTVRGEDGFITRLTVRGTTLNVCAALAA